MAFTVWFVRNSADFSGLYGGLIDFIASPGRERSVLEASRSCSEVAAAGSPVKFFLRRRPCPAFSELEGSHRLVAINIGGPCLPLAYATLIHYIPSHPINRAVVREEGAKLARPLT